MIDKLNKKIESRNTIALSTLQTYNMKLAMHDNY